MKRVYLETLGKYLNGILIEKFPDVIYSLIVDEIGLKKNDNDIPLIDTNSFSANIRKSDEWNAAFSLGNIQSRKLLNELARDSELLLAVDSLNRLKAIPLDNREPVISISTNDLAVDQFGLPDMEITESNKVYNSFRIFYCYDYESQEYLKTEFINNSSTSLSALENSKNNQTGFYTGLCLESLNHYKNNEEYIIKSSYIRDRATAQIFIKHLTERLSFKKDKIIMKTLMNAKTLVLEIGDTVEILMLAQNLDGKRFMISKVCFDFLQRNIVFDLFQL
jgi:hypothetical protein